MPQRIERVSYSPSASRSRAHECDLLLPEGSWVVWWYSRLKRNAFDHSVPLVLVIFRQLQGSTLTNQFVQRKIALSRLGFYQPGYILEKNLVSGRISTDSKWLDVNFRIAGDNWKLKKASELKLCDSESHFLLPKQCADDWLIEFKMAGGVLLLNCVEFLVRAYSRRSEIPRILATYDWDEVRSRLLAQETPDSELISKSKLPDGNQKWIVYPNKNMVTDDDIFLAHIANNNTHATRAARQIFSQLNTKDFIEGKSFPIQIIPWFDSETKLKCRGFGFGEGNSFYCTELTGLQEPSGVKIEARREQASNIPTPEDVAEKERLRLLTVDPIMLAQTDVKQPRSDNPRAEIEDSSFEVLRNRKVDRVKVPKLTGRQKTIQDDSAEIEDFGTGDPAAQRSDTTGKVVLATREFGANSQGALHEMWNAFERLKAAKKIQNLWWFVPPDNKYANSDFQCVPFTENSNEAKRSKWITLKNGDRRGLLLILIRAEDKFFLVVEIQRDIHIKKNGDLEEKSYSGFICKVENSLQASAIAQTLDEQLPQKRGVFKNIHIGADIQSDTFEHKKTGNPDGWLDATAVLALNKMGLKISRVSKAPLQKDPQNRDR